MYNLFESHSWVFSPFFVALFSIALFLAALSRHFSTCDHLGSMMWTILIVGGVITICFIPLAIQELVFEL